MKRWFDGRLGFESCPLQGKLWACSGLLKGQSWEQCGHFVKTDVGLTLVKEDFYSVWNRTKLKWTLRDPGAGCVPIGTLWEGFLLWAGGLTK